MDVAVIGGEDGSDKKKEETDAEGGDDSSHQSEHPKDGDSEGVTEGDEEIESADGDDHHDEDHEDNDEEDEDDEEADVCVEDDDTVERDDDIEHLDVLGAVDQDVEMDLDELQAVVGAVENTEQQDILGTSKSKISPLARRRTYIQACMQVLEAQYPHMHARVPHYLTVTGENYLLKALNKIVKPPVKPLNTKIIMRRAPTQEEFFRGSLSRNPISLASLKKGDPTVADLRQHIANDLQMADSAELIEIIVGDKILDVNLKLRVVYQVLWKKHLIEHSGTGDRATYFSSGSVLSIILSDRGHGLKITADTPASALPPMIATYRLTGVDGEATEDTVGVEDLLDPEVPSHSASPEEAEKLLESEYGITRLVTEGRGVLTLLRSIQNSISDTLRRIRRDDIGCVNGNNPSRAQFKQSAPLPWLGVITSLF